MNKTVKKLCISGLLIAIGMILPFITGQIPLIGKILSPLHYPAFFAGLLCGWPYGLVIGIICPLLRAALFGMPAMFPMGITMAAECGVYGLVCGLLFYRSKNKTLLQLYLTLLAAMILGRVAYGIVMWAILGSSYTFTLFISGTFALGLPGIILQLVLVPLIMAALREVRVSPKSQAKAEV